MRIEERIGAEAASRQSAAGAAEVQRTRATPEGGAAGGAAGDVAQISTLAGRIRSRLDALAGEHAARLERLTAEVRSGRYQPDVAALSRVLTAEALGVER